MPSPSRLVTSGAYATVGLWFLLLPSVSLGQNFITPKDIDDYLQTHPPSQNHGPSPIAGNGLMFVINGLAYNVDPRLIVAIAGAESSLGTNYMACPPEGLNAWSWFYNGDFSKSLGHSRCADSPFGSYAGGVRVVTKFMRLSYLGAPQPAKTIEDIKNLGYCKEH